MKRSKQAGSSHVVAIKTKTYLRRRLEIGKGPTAVLWCNTVDGTKPERPG